MSTNDVYLANVSMLRGPTVIRNIFTFRALVNDAISERIGDIIIGDYFPIWKDCLHSEVTLQGVFVENLNDDEDFFQGVPASPVAGTRGGTIAPDNIAALIFAPTKNRSIRQGQKRIGPFGVGDMQGNTLSGSSGIVGELEQLALKFSDNIPALLTGSVAEPIIIKRIPYVTPAGNPAYRVPQTASAGSFYKADNWAVKSLLSSQNTRKPRRGE